MRAILERDVPLRLRERAFFRLRGLAALAGAVGLAVAVLGHRGAPPDVIGLRAFTLSSTLLLWVVALALPAQFAQLLARERAADALGVLLTTPLSASSLVLGWWLSRISYAALLVVPGLPFLALPLVLGGIVPAQLAQVLAVLGATVLWLSTGSLLVGALVRNPYSATRTAYALAALLTLVVPRLGGSNLLETVSPFPMLAAILSGTLPSEQLALHLVFAGLVAALSLIACMRIVRRDAERSRAGGSTPWVARCAARLFAPLVEARPVLWLGCSRGAHFLFHWTALVAVLGVLLAEGAFVRDLREIYSAVGEPLLRGPDGAAAAAALHLRYAFAYLALSLLTGIVSAATTFHRELATNTLDVFFSTPLTTERIVHGLAIASVAAATPFLLLALSHVGVGVLGGSLTAFHGLVALVCMPVAVTYVCTAAFLAGLRKETPVRSTLSGLLALFRAPYLPDARWTPFPVALFVVFALMLVFGSAVLRMLMLLFPIVYAFVPLGAGGGREDAAVLLVALLLTAVYVLSIHRHVTLEIPQRLLLKRDQKYVPLAWYEPEAAPRRRRRPRRRGRRAPAGRGFGRPDAPPRTAPPE